MPDDTQPPAEEFPSLDQVQSALTESQADPLKSAEVIRNWRNEAALQLDQHFTDPQERNRAADQLDTSTTDALRQQQGAAVDSWASMRFPGDDQSAQDFLSSYSEAAGDPQKLPEQYRGLASELEKIAGAQQFKPTFEGRNATGSIMAGETKIGAFTTRELPHKGETQAFVTPITPGVEQPDIADAPKIQVTVPTPTKADLEAEAQKANDEADQIDQRITDIVMNPENNTPTQQLDRQAKELRDKAKALSGPGGRQLLTSELIRNRLKEPEYQDRIGQYAGGEEIKKGLLNAVFSAGSIKARAQDMMAGGEENLSRIAEAKQEMEVAMPGSTRRTFEGGFGNENIQALQRMGGEMIPYMAGAGVARAALGAAEAAGSSVAARELATRAANASGMGAMGAGMGAGATGAAYADTQQKINEAEAAGDTARAAELRQGRDAHAVVTGLLMSGFSKMSPLHNLKASGNTATTWAKDILGQALENPAQTVAQGVLVDPLIGDRPDVAQQLPGAFVQGAAMALAMGALTRTGQRLQEGLGMAEASRVRAKDIAQTSGAADPQTLAAIDAIHDQRAQNLANQAKAQGVQQVEQIKATAADMEQHNAAIDKIRSAESEGLIPEEPPLPADAPKEQQQLRDIREKQAAARSLELQLMDVERDPNLTGEERGAMREPLIKEKTKAEIELLKLRRTLPETHAPMEKVAAELPPEEVTVREADPANAGETIPPRPTSDNPSTIPPPYQSAPVPEPQPEPVAASDQSSPTPAADIPSAEPNIREPWVKNALALAGQGKDQRGPLAGALKALTPSERAIVAERAGVSNPTLDDHILLAREMSDAASKSQSNASGDPSIRPQVAERSNSYGDTLGLTHAETDAHRQRLGMEPRAAKLARDFPGLAVEADAILANNPHAGYQRVKELLGGNTPHHDVDIPLLERHLIELENAAQIEARIINSGHTSAEDRAVAASRRGELLASMADTIRASDEAGSATGRSLNARKLMRDRQTVPTQAEALADARTDKGSPLTAEETDKTLRLQKEMEVAKQERDNQALIDQEKVEMSAMSATVNEILTEMEKEIPGNLPEPPKKPVRDALKKKAEAARVAIRKSSGGVSFLGTKDLENLPHYAVIMASHIAEAVGNVKDGLQRFAKEFPHMSKDLMKRVLGQAQNLSFQVDERLAKVSKAAQDLKGPSVQGVIISNKRVVDPNGAIDPAVARALMKAHIREGVSDVHNLTTLLTGSLQELYPGSTESDARMAVTGLGKPTMPSSDPLVKEMADMKAQMALIENIRRLKEDAASPLRRGDQRQKSSDQARALQAELNDLMRKSGYNAKGDMDLRGRLDAIKSGLRNHIEYLENVKAGREKLRTKGTDIERDAEAKELQGRIDTIYSLIKALPENAAKIDAAAEERMLQAAQKSRDLYRDRVRDKEFEYRKNPTKQVKAELRTMRAERDLAAQEYRDARAASEAGKTRQMEKDIAAATKAVEDKERQLIEENWTTKNPGKKVSDNPELKLLQERSAELTKALRDQKYGDGMEAFTKWYNDRLKTLKDSLAGIEKAKPPGRIVPDNAETKAMKAEIKDLEKLRAEKLAPEKGLKAIEKRIVEMQRKIDQNDLSGPVSKSKFETPEMKSRQQYLDQLTEIHDKMVADDGTLANQKFQKRLVVREAKMDEHRKAGFPGKQPKVELKLTPESVAAEARFRESMKRYYEDRLAHSLSKMSRAGKAWDFTKQSLAVARTVLTGGEFSMAGRQGLLPATMAPTQVPRALVEMLKSFASEHQVTKAALELEKRPNFHLYERDKLFLSDVKDWTEKKVEEANTGRWARKIPFLKNFERANSTILNILRANAYDAMHNMHEALGGEPTREQGRNIAWQVNVMSGRGEFGKFETARDVGSKLLFSPGHTVSRFQYLLGGALWRGDAKSKAVIALAYAKTFAALGALVLLGNYASDKDKPMEFDPRSADFLKMRMGNTHVDVLAGLVQSMVFMARIASRSTKTQSGVIVPLHGKVKYGQADVVDVAGRFARSKMNPFLGAASSAWAERDFMGRPTDLKSQLNQFWKPMTWTEIQQASEKQGVPKKLFFFMAGMLGAGINTYDSKNN